MAESVIKKNTSMVYHLNNVLKSVSTTIAITPINNNNTMLISVARFGRTAGFCCTGSSLLTSTNGIRLPFGEDGSTITIVGNGSNGISITSSISALADVYITVLEILP